MRTYIALLCLLCSLLSCTEKVSGTGQKGSVTYQSSQSNNYMTCNFFADNTFRGYIYSSPKKDCFYLDIIESPRDLLKNDDLFLQIYPFTVSGDKPKYGTSIPIYTIEKFNRDEVLMKSYIIDTHIVKVDLQLEEDYFFLDHMFELCELDQTWDGLLLVVYQRRENEDSSASVKKTQFLKPPILIHPEYFKEAKNDTLAAYHPFFGYIPQFKSDPNKYYELADQLCSEVD